MSRGLGLILLTVVLVISGCKQDPYENHPDSIRNGVPPDKKPGKEPDRNLDAVLDGPSLLGFAEGVEGKFTIKGRVLNLPNEKIPWKVSLQSGPKDMKYDGNTGLLVWTPVTGTTGSATAITDTLVFRVEISTPYSIADIVLPYFVTKSTQTPEILKIEGLEKPVVEGELRAFRVVVKDLSASATKPPMMMFFAPDSGFGKRNGAPYVYPNALNPIDGGNGGVWAFNYYVNGLDAELKEPEEWTRGITGFSVMFRLISAVGVPSMDLEGKLIAANVARVPIVSFGAPGNTVVKVGDKVTLGFTVYSKNTDGNLTITFPTVSTIPGAVPNCTKPFTTSDQFDCTLKWEVPANAAASYTLRVNVVNNVGGTAGVPPTTSQINVDRVIQVTR